MRLDKYFLIYLSKIFYLDLRSLALFRIGLGLVILLMLYGLYPEIDAFYGPNGIAPLSAIKKDLYWSFHAISDNYFFLRIIFILHALCAIMLILGLRTRLATFLCWCMTTSLINRDPIVIYGADRIVQVFLMWGVFLPLGARFSLDKCTTKTTQKTSQQFFSIACITFCCQIILIYVFNGLAKNHSSWAYDFTALNYIFSGSEFTKPFATLLLPFPSVMKCLTIFTRSLELYGGLLLLIPIFPSLFRSISVIIFIIFHSCIFLTMDVGLLPASMIIVWIALIPSAWWQESNPHKIKFDPDDFRINKNANFIILLIFIYIFVLNYRYAAINIFRNNSQENIIEDFAKKTGLYQKWSMFAPGPPLYERKYYFIPVYETGVLTQHLIESSPIEITGNDRWHFVLSRIHLLEFKEYKKRMLSYITSIWNNEGNKRQKITTVKIFYRDFPIQPILTPKKL